MPDPAPGGAAAGPEPLRLGRRGVRRFGAHLGLLAALAAVFILCSAAAGTCLLLLTAGEQRALSQAVARVHGSTSDGVDLATMVVLADKSSDAAPTADRLLPLVRETLRKAAGSYRSAVSTWTSSRTLFLDGPDVRRGYLVEADAIGANATLRDGAWPAAAGQDAPIPVAVPATAADQLGIGVGSKLRLVSDRSGAESATFTLVVSGIFTPAETPIWDRDELSGRGYVPDHFRLPTFGPFVVAAGTLEARSAPLDQVIAELDPSLGRDAAGVPAYLQRLNAAPQLLQDQAGPTVSQVLIRSPLGAEYQGWRSTLRVTEALMVTVFLLVLALGAATTALIAAALARRRAAEHTLLRDRGASRGQLVASAAVEASVIALLAAVVAAPLALIGYRLTAPGAGGWWPAGLAMPELVAFAAALLAGALLPAAVVVLSALPQRPRSGRTSGVGVFVRSGADLMLVAVAVLAYLQLRAHRPTPGMIDPFLAGAPAVAALAVAALLARLLPLLGRVAERAAGRGRGLVWPLAGWQLARGGATGGVFLVVLATAVGTLGTTFLATWAVSQDDQASALVGAEVVVGRAGGAVTGQRLSELAGAKASPVSDRPIVLGSRPDGVSLLAMDAGQSGLPDGRPPARTDWAQVLAGLRPQTQAVPLSLAAGPIALTLTGERRANPADAGRPEPVLTATPTLVLSDGAGTTITLTGAELALDGRPHTIALPLTAQPALPPGQWQVVAIDLLLLDHTSVDLISWGMNPATVELSMRLAGASGPGGEWDAAGDTGPGDVRLGTASASGDTVTASYSYTVLGLSWQAAHLILLGFPASAQVPVAVSQDLAGELGLAHGDRIALSWDSTQLEAVVSRTIEYVPSHVRQPALLADLTSLQRALLSVGRLDPSTTAWWIGSARPGAAEAIRAAGQGPVTDRDETAADLRDGPLRAPVPYAWLLAVVVAVGLAIGGSASQAAAQAQQRWSTVARLRAIGTSRREALTSHFAQHAAVTALAVTLGAVGGAVLALALVPLLMVTPAGEPTVPSATVVWAAGPMSAVIAAVLLGGLLAGVPAAVAMVGRSTVTALRLGEAQ